MPPLQKEMCALLGRKWEDRTLPAAVNPLLHSAQLFYAKVAHFEVVYFDSIHIYILF